MFLKTETIFRLNFKTIARSMNACLLSVYLTRIPCHRRPNFLCASHARVITLRLHVSPLRWSSFAKYILIFLRRTSSSRKENILQKHKTHFCVLCGASWRNVAEKPENRKLFAHFYWNVYKGFPLFHFVLTFFFSIRIIFNAIYLLIVAKWMVALF